MNEYASVEELKVAIENYVEFYNHRRWHQSLDYKTPASVFFTEVEEKESVDICTSPMGQTAPFGTYGQVMDNATALPTT